MTKILSMLASASSSISLFPSDNEQSTQLMKTDAEQLAEDWQGVGDDLRQAMNQEAVEHGEKNKEK